MTGLSALPLAQETGHVDQQQKFKGASRILGPRWAHLPAITIGLLGVQIFWSVEMSYASPYLLSLGLSKSSMAVVFVAGPLSGLIMQPLIGVLADNCTSGFGRRRPYMILGTVICMTAMLLLGFTRQVASIFTEWNTHTNDVLTIWLAVLSIYLIDFSINAVQAVDRALLVDTLPPTEQAAGNAWAARMLGFGSVIGFFVGNINLPKLFPSLGTSQLQVLSVIVSLLLLGGHLLMAGLVKEKVLLKTIKSDRKSFSQEIKDIWNNIRTLPRVIRQICIIQFFAWIAWFPVLFYSTIYVGDLHKRSSPVPFNEDEKVALDAEATRLGSRALFLSALLSLFVNLTLPLFVAEAAISNKNHGGSWLERNCSIPRSLQTHLATLWAISHLVFATCMGATFFTHSVWGSTLIITVTGFSWAITQWAPFSLLAEAILTEPAPHTPEDAGSIRLTDTRTSERDAFLSEHDIDEDEEARREEHRRVLSNSGAQLSRIDLHQEDDDYENVVNPQQRTRAEPGTLSAKAGIILGIHNIFIVIPQFLVTGFSAILFAIFDPSKPGFPGHRAPIAHAPAKNSTMLLSQDLTTLVNRAESLDDSSHSNSVVYIFRIGGIAAAFAFVMCWRLARELRHK